MRFDEAFLSNFGSGFDNAWKGADDARARKEQNAADDARLERRFSESKAEQERSLDARATEYRDTNTRLEATEKAKREQEQAKLDQYAKDREADRVARQGDREDTLNFRKEVKDQSDYDRAYARHSAALQQADPIQSAKELQPIFLRKAKGEPLATEERAQLDAGRDAYGLLRQSLRTRPMDEQVVKTYQKKADGTDDMSLDPVITKRRIPRTDWTPQELPPFEQAMMPDAARMMNAGPYNLNFGGAPVKKTAPSPLERSGIASQVLAADAAKRKAEAERVAAAELAAKTAAREAGLKKTIDSGMYWGGGGFGG